MRIGCVTTTIHVPRVLALYAKYGPDVMFFVVGDRRTPDEDVVVFLQENVPNHAYYGIDVQYKLGYKCARLIPENCIQRRNVGFLEALKWGADVVVSIDDDNIPLAKRNYFADITSSWEIAGYRAKSYDGLCGCSASGWFDIGQLLQPKAEHRGFPHTKRAPPSFEPVIDAKIGVAAGICLGDPDIGAVERIANGPTVHGVSEILRSGVVTDPRQTWTVFNSQNTAVIRELVPAWFMFPNCGRYDDIFASLLLQRVMQEKDYYVHFGAPFVWQQRNHHDLIKDLHAEIDGMEKIMHFADFLDRTVVEKAEVVDLARAFMQVIPFNGIYSQAFEAWCDDCEAVMK